MAQRGPWGAQRHRQEHETAAEGGEQQRLLPLVAMVADPLGPLGQAVSLALAEQGARLHLVGGPQDKPQLEDLGRTCASVGAPAVDIQCADGPLTEEQVLHKIMRLILSRHGTLDVVVTCPPTDDSSGAAGNTSHGEASEGHPRGKGKAGGLIRKLGVIKLRPTLKAAATTVLHGGTPPGVMGRPPLAHHAPGTFVRQLVKEVQQDLAERKEGWSSCTRALVMFLDPPGQEQGRLAWGDLAAETLAPLGFRVLQVLLPEDPPHTSWPSQAEASALAQLALIPWRQPLALGVMHEVSISMPAPPPSSLSLQHAIHMAGAAAGAAMGPGAGGASPAWMQLQLRSHTCSYAPGAGRAGVETRMAVTGGAGSVSAEGLGAEAAAGKAGAGEAAQGDGGGARAGAPAGPEVEEEVQGEAVEQEKELEHGRATAAHAAQLQPAGAAGEQAVAVGEGAAAPLWGRGVVDKLLAPSGASSTSAAPVALQAILYCPGAGSTGPAFQQGPEEAGAGAGEAGTGAGLGAKGVTRRAAAAEAVWLHPDPASSSVGGLVAATGARKPPGLLCRPAAPGELGLARQDRAGAVLTPGDPQNLEPSLKPGDYPHEPMRDPRLMVHCWMPFNAETPHNILSQEYLTPAPLFYVRSHLPVPEPPKLTEYRLHLSGLGASETELSLQDLQSGRYGPVMEQVVTLQCAGNRRNEMAAVGLVEGRAPWNHGGIGNSLWTGVLLADVLAAAGVDVAGMRQQLHAGSTAGGGTLQCPRHLVMQGRDWHRVTGQHYEISVPLAKVLDPAHGAMLAWAQGGEPLLPDHGYPLRAIVPGVVGARSVKWLHSLRLSDSESQAPWQQIDYKLMPPKFSTHLEWKPHHASMPAIQDLPVQSAILEPEPGSVVPAGTQAVWVRGYAWCGGGVPIIRVDVSADGGRSWEQADVEEHGASPRNSSKPQRTHGGSGHAGQSEQEAARARAEAVEAARAAHGESALVGSEECAWAWVKWQLPMEVPEHLRQAGGKWSLTVKAINRHCNSQPASVESVWNFRGLACNAWHRVDLAVAPPHMHGL